ncbi:hypothetical protein C446_05115 [Halobiforma nitratireducens JCM 10879]|uniref:Archaeal Type IV pilin N-terminal domain-containing protein n=2 Tax=Halobiforma nitratireducens TaxID=130048 RepID=M0M8J0_9EURY|nr:hypothetical protein C446_05115 [Halobiforma nitratireducens JCM 10879]
MVAITVILAAVIATFVLDLGDTTANPMAGIDIGADNTDEEVEVELRTIERLDEAYVAIDGAELETEDAGGSTDRLESVGDTVVIDDDNSADTLNIESEGSWGDTVQVIGVYEGEEAILQEHETDGDWG